MALPGPDTPIGWSGQLDQPRTHLTHQGHERRLDALGIGAGLRPVGSYVDPGVLEKRVFELEQRVAELEEARELAAIPWWRRLRAAFEAWRQG